MSTTTQTPTRTTTSAPTSSTERQPVWKHGVASAVVASVATTVLAAIASAAGVSFAGSTGASIPIAGFAQLTLVFSLVGVGIAAVIARKARRPRATFVRTAVALTALSGKRTHLPQIVMAVARPVWRSGLPCRGGGRWRRRWIGR